MRTNLLKLFLLFLTGTISANIKAQTDWANVYCYDSAFNVQSIVNKNDTLYSASYSPAVFSMSTNGGATWTALNNLKLYSYPSKLLVFDDVIYNYEAGLYIGMIIKLLKYTNNTWVEDTVGLQGNSPQRLTVAGERLYTYTVYPNNKVYTKTSHNSSWTKVSGFEAINGAKPMFTKKGNTYYAILYKVFDKKTLVWTSTDGINYTQMNTVGLPPDDPHMFITHNNCMYINYFNDTKRPAIYKSCDNGANWSDVSPFKNPNGTLCNVLFTDSNRLYAVGNIYNYSNNIFSVYYTSDNGLTWNDITDTSAALAPNYYISDIAKFDTTLLVSHGKIGSDTSVKSCIKRYTPRYTINTGLSELKKATINGIYPNPTNKYVTILLPTNLNVTQLEILNLQGQLIKTIPLTDAETIKSIVVDIEDILPGIYFVKIGNNMHKLIKQ